MAKAKKLSSGNWNCKVYDYTDEQGKRHYRSFTSETKKEAEFLAVQYLNEKTTRTTDPTQLTVSQVIERYLNMSNDLSPTTRHAYEKIKQYAFQSIMEKPVRSLKDYDMQAAINTEGKRVIEHTKRTISPKTVKNEWGLVSAAIRAVCGLTYNIKLPKTQTTIEILPEPEQVLNVIVGSDIELPCLLAMWMSLRMSEIKGLMCSSIRNGYLIIDQVMVSVGTEEIIKQDTKTESSKRILHIPDYIMNLIEDADTYKEYKQTGKDTILIPLTHSQLYNRFTRRMKKAGVNMSFHDLRHIFASVSLNVLNISPKSVQTSGGWSSNSIMDKVYSQSFSNVQRQADETRDSYFMSMISCTNI